MNSIFYSSNTPQRAGLVLGLLLAAVQGAAGQRLQAVGVAASFSMGQTWARQTSLSVAQFQLLTDIDGSRLDDTGHRFSGFARVGVGVGRFFVQPEVAYSAVLRQANSLIYFSRPSAPAPDEVIFTPRVRRFELAALAGMRLGKRGYLLAGPVLAYHLRERYGDASAVGAPLVQSLYDSVVPVQLLAQGGVGTTLWRFDVSARYEHSLTPYTRKFEYAGQEYAYYQSTSQVILNLGFLLHDSRRPRR